MTASSQRAGRVRFVVLLLAMLLVGMATPSVAGSVVARARNADKVDHLSAVKATASVKKRRGKLVATDKTTGLLPNDLIAKAPDAESVDGLDSTAFVQGASVRHLEAKCVGLGFLPEASTTTYAAIAGMHYTTSAGALSCPVDLPTGAVIRTVTFTAYDNTAADDSCTLHSDSATSGAVSDVLLANVATTGATTAFQTLTDTSISVPLVAADSYYFLACTLGTTPNNAVVSGAVAYDITASGSTPQ